MLFHLRWRVGWVRVKVERLDYLKTKIKNKNSCPFPHLGSAVEVYLRTTKNKNPCPLPIPFFFRAHLLSIGAHFLSRFRAHFLSRSERQRTRIRAHLLSIRAHFLSHSERLAHFNPCPLPITWVRRMKATSDCHKIKSTTIAIWNQLHHQLHHSCRDGKPECWWGRPEVSSVSTSFRM